MGTVPNSHCVPASSWRFALFSARIRAMARGDGGDYLSVSEDDALMVEADEEGFAEAPRRVLQRDYKRDGGGCLRCRCCAGC